MSPASSLIRTKIAPPRLGSAALGRERLLDQLQARRDRMVTLILGPAGSGKTTLAALWRQRLIAAGAEVAWYNVGEDDDEGQWAAYWFAALEAAGVDVGPALAQALQSEGFETADRFVAQVVNAAFAHVRPIVMVLEDLHVLRARQPFAMLQQLLRHLPGNFHLAITARTAPPLDLGLLRSRDQVTDVSFDELRLSVEEQATFLDTLGVGRLSASQARRLYGLTEGWVAGTQLAALALRKGRETDSVLHHLRGLAAPAGDDGMTGVVADAFGSVLEPEQIAILVRLSACRRFTPALCDAICGGTEASALVETLAAQQSFVVPIDSGEALPWFRFHRIFAAFLRQRLRALPAPDLAAINRRASLWFEAQGLTTEALRHARHAGDTSRMAALIGGAARPLLYAGQFLPLLRWAADLPAAARTERIDVLLSIGWSEVSARRHGDVAATIAAIEAHPAAARPEVDFELRLLRALDHVMRDDTAAAMALLAPVLDAPPAVDGFGLLMLGAVGGMALIGAGQHERARDIAADCQAALRRRHGARSRPWLEGVGGHSFLVQGDFVQARDMLSRSLRDLAREEQLAEYSAGHLAAYRAEADYQLNDLEAAEDDLDLFAESGDSTAGPDVALHALRTKARLHALQGDRERALATLDGMERLAQDEGWDRLAAWSLAERVRLLGRRAAGMTAMREALRRLRRMAARHAGATGTLAEIGLAAAIAAVDAATAECDWQQVVDAAGPLADELRRRGRLFLAARQTMMAAAAHLALGDEVAALRLGRGLLMTAEHCGMYRLFLDGGAPATDLAARLRALPDLKPEECRLLDDSLGNRHPPPVAVPAAALSPKEREIVQLLDRALSVKTIARALNVSPGTIKWHLKNVYAKLGAVSREDAVAKARTLKILA
ncbi:LuxR C-terminal-related transcriptional regulator [Zavarzinia sp.]|uniref:helix-turn-helix transcriptional regulator n=1 Tax=Zavarzinia sp. TaxID=2027920 RepID=UPI0035693C66